jgi:hypothetical protein
MPQTEGLVSRQSAEFRKVPGRQRGSAEVSAAALRPG